MWKPDGFIKAAETNSAGTLRRLLGTLAAMNGRRKKKKTPGGERSRGKRDDSTPELSAAQIVKLNFEFNPKVEASSTAPGGGRSAAAAY